MSFPLRWALFPLSIFPALFTILPLTPSILWKDPSGKFHSASIHSNSDQGLNVHTYRQLDCPISSLMLPQASLGSQAVTGWWASVSVDTGCFTGQVLPNFTLFPSPKLFVCLLPLSTFMHLLILVPISMSSFCLQSNLETWAPHCGNKSQNSGQLWIPGHRLFSGYLSLDSSWDINCAFLVWLAPPRRKQIIIMTVHLTCVLLWTCSLEREPRNCGPSVTLFLLYCSYFILWRIQQAGPSRDGTQRGDAEDSAKTGRRWRYIN